MDQEEAVVGLVAGHRVEAQVELLQLLVLPQTIQLLQPPDVVVVSGVLVKVFLRDNLTLHMASC